jgi:TetR/AcrR family transcriptional regulator, regulator of cefoperazone and chloramphenicol sensitivity
MCSIRLALSRPPTGSCALTSVNEDTRDRLLDAAQELFARTGSWTTPLARVVRAAGQRNQSAIHYHFGSREELIYALIERDRAREMQERQAGLDRFEADGGNDDLRTAVATLVLPSCAGLEEQRGRRLRMIIADVVRGIGDDQLADPRPPDLARSIRLIETAMPPMPARVGTTRIAAAMRLLIEMTAARARTIEAGERPLVGARAFERDLIEMIHGLLAAPRP